MVATLARVLQNVKREYASHRSIGPRIPLGAADHGGPRRAGAPWRFAAALGVAQWVADLPGVASRLRHQPRLAEHPVEGAPAAAHRGPRGCGLFPDATWL